ncbi:MAG: LCP family protein [Nitriliruptorales bacterium]|nr:LCP family protein [Nitriliruptorales bacterium]
MIRRALVAFLAPLLVAAGLQAAPQLLYQPVEDDVITVLLLGADQGPPRGGSPLDARADAFHLLVVSPDRKHASFLNFPRDSWVPVAGVGTTKINACLVGGPERCVATVENLFDTKVDAWFVTSMHGMADAFADFGGVEVDVETPVYDGGADITETGPQVLRGEALTFARDRKNRSGGDFRRTEAQGELLIAAHHKLLAERRSVAGTLEAVRILRSHSVTNATPAQLLRYGFTALEVETVHNVNVPGYASTAGAASVVRLTDDAFPLVRDVLQDGKPPQD